MLKISTFDDVKNDDSWRAQIQLANTPSEIFTRRAQGTKNFTLHRRKFDTKMRQAFKELTQFYIDKYEIAPNGSQLLYGEDSTITFSPTQGTEKLSYNAQNAAKLLADDLRTFTKAGGIGGYLRLRLQGKDVINNDSVWHHDGAGTKGIRYSGDLTQEAHNDDVLSCKGDQATVKDDARILVANHGDIWRHDTPSFFNPFCKRQHRIHRKPPPTIGEPGLILTLQ